MRKHFCLSKVIAILFLFASLCNSSVSYAQLSKQGKKAVKELVKRYNSEGYKSESMLYTMSEEISRFRQKVETGDYTVLTSDGAGASSFAAEASALQAAASLYATAAGSTITAGLEREIGNVGENYDIFHGSYVQNVQKYITPLLKKEMKFIKQNSNIVSVRVGYSIDENSAKKAREEALDATVKTVAEGQAFGDAVRKYVEQNVSVTE
ncbi:MAG: hypothetical protein IJR07_08730 [Bacteroidaceae bacterium]|nr:hypothetical protein [Bacteroidaceae bacterium]